MDIMKKLAVLITGALVVVFVGWVLSISAQNTSARMHPPQNKVLQKELPQKSAGEAANPMVPAPEGGSEAEPADQARRPIRWRTSKESTVRPETPAPQISGRAPLSGNPNPIFINAARQILPAVVSIESSRRMKSPRFDLFHPFLKRDEEEENEGDEYLPGSGSGIIITEDGYILTNNHVVEDAAELKVKLYDKREFSATIVGTDPTTDLAIIHIEATELPAALIGDSDSVQIGEWVMAVGNPLNFTSTVTTGIVSAIGRNINIIDASRYRYRIENFIQTDAVINPGNSGGALVNLNGEVVGLNTAIATRSGYYQGYGFAIPVNLAKKVAQDLIVYGRVRRAILGVVIDPVTDQTARSEGLSKPTGAYIQSVQRGSPAEKAGLRQGDIVLAVNGSEVVSVNDLQTKIAQHHPGDVVRLDVWRDGEKWQVDVELGEVPPEELPPVSATEPKETKPLFENLGITLRELTPEEKERFGVDTGLYVEDVVFGSPAAKSGMFRSHILLSVNQEPVNSVAEFEKRIAGVPAGEILKLKVKIPNLGESRILYVEVP